MWQELKHKLVKTRKKHMCHGCCKSFPKDTAMIYTAGVIDGDFWSSYTCPKCEAFINSKHFSWKNHEDGLEEGGVAEYWEYDEFKIDETNMDSR